MDADYLAQLDAAIAASDAVSPAPWGPQEDRIVDARGDVVAAGVLAVDRRALVALRNAWPLIRARLPELATSPGTVPDCG